MKFEYLSSAVYHNSQTMMRLILSSLLAVTVSAQALKRVFTATMLPLDGSGVTGTVTVFIASDDTVAYAGWARGLEPLLGPDDCTELNGKFACCRQRRNCLNDTQNS